MRTDSISLSWRSDACERALNLATLVAQELELDEKEKDNLLMLTEETLSMQAAILGGYAGNLFFKINDNKCELVIKSEETISEDLKNTLIRMSSSGENEFKTSIGDKISDFFKELRDSNDFMDALDEHCAEDKVLVIKTKDGEIWDESERAILHHYADEIRVGVKKNKIVIRVIKKY